MSTNQNDPDVVIFGQTLDTQKWEDDTSQRVVSGIFFIFAGIVFLLNTLDLLPWAVWGELIRFWPLLLILGGLQILLGTTRIAKWLMLLITLAIFSLVLLSILDEPFPNLLPNLPSFIQQAAGFLKDLVN